MKSVVHQLLSRIAVVGECWIWQGGRSVNGYGRIRYGKRQEYTHVVSYRIHGGVIQAGQFVRHNCDTPLCVNPAHLVVGTHADNMRDMVSRGRSAKGERHSQAKLTAEAVIAIRSSSSSYSKLADRFGVTQATICDIRKRRSWAHI